MSDMQADPYQPQSYSPDQALKPSGRMEYMRSVSYIFENPNWLQNLLFTALCTFIPIVGGLVVYGYQFEIVETLHLRRGAGYPDFTFDRFVDYLVRGLWVFLVAFVVSLVVVPVMLGILLLGSVAIGAAGAAGGEQAAAVGAIIIVPVVFVGGFALAVLLNMFMVPFILRAGLTQDFGASFDFGFSKRFVANTWGQMIMATLFFMVAVIILEIIGLAVMCIGIIFTMAVAMLMQAHLAFQLYEVHLARGGDPIPMQPRKVV